MKTNLLRKLLLLATLSCLFVVEVQPRRPSKNLCCGAKVAFQKRVRDQRARHREAALAKRRSSADDGVTVAEDVSQSKDTLIDEFREQCARGLPKIGAHQMIFSRNDDFTSNELALLGPGRDDFLMSMSAGTVQETLSELSLKLKFLFKKYQCTNPTDLLLSILSLTKGLQEPVDTIRLLVFAGADVNVRNCQDFDPLSLAIDADALDVVAFLISVGADVGACDRAGDTPLHVAAYNGRTQAVFLLIRAGADVNALNRDNATPLHYAALAGRADVVSVLLGAGADRFSFSRSGDTPAWLAATNGHPEIAALIEGGGAKA